MKPFIDLEILMTVGRKKRESKTDDKVRMKADHYAYLSLHILILNPVLENKAAL